MGDFKTNNLKLIKPQSGTRNWGNVLNNDLDLIDAGYSKLSGKIQALSAQLTAAGMFSFVDGAEWINIKGNKDNISDIEYEFGTVTSHQINEGINYNFYSFNFTRAAEDHEYYTLTTYSQLSTIPDNTAFYVFFDSVDNVNVNTSDNNEQYIIVGGINYYLGDVVVKTTVAESDQSVTKLIKIQQALGGFYMPYTQNSTDPNTITFVKQTTPYAIPKVNMFIPKNMFNGITNTVTLTPSNTGSGIVINKNNDNYIINTNISSTIVENITSSITDGEPITNQTTYAQDIVDVIFTIDNKTISLDYTINLNTDNIYEIVIDGKYITDGTVVCKYTQTKYTQQTNTITE